MKKYISIILLFILTLTLTSCSFFVTEVGGNDTNANKPNTELPGDNIGENDNNDNTNKLLVPGNIILDGRIIKWDNVEGATGYTVLIDNKNEYLVDTNQYKVSYNTNTTFNVKIKATCNNTNFNDSDYSDVYTLEYKHIPEKLATPTGLKYVKEQLIYMWNSVELAEKYEYVIIDNNTDKIIDTDFTYSYVAYFKHMYRTNITIKVRAIANGYLTSDWVEFSHEYIPTKEANHIELLCNLGLGAGVDGLDTNETKKPSIFDQNKLYNNDIVCINKHDKLYSKDEEYIATSYRELINKMSQKRNSANYTNDYIMDYRLHSANDYMIDKWIRESSASDLVFYYISSSIKMEYAYIRKNNIKNYYDYISDDVYNEIKNIKTTTDAEWFYNKYGTHAIFSAEFGGRFNYSFTLESNNQKATNRVINTLPKRIPYSIINVLSNKINDITGLRLYSSESHYYESNCGEYIGGDSKYTKFDTKTFNTNGKLWKDSLTGFDDAGNDANYKLVGLEYDSLVSYIDIFKSLDLDQYVLNCFITAFNNRSNKIEKAVNEKIDSISSDITSFNMTVYEHKLKRTGYDFYTYNDSNIYNEDYINFSRFNIVSDLYYEVKVTIQCKRQADEFGFWGKKYPITGIRARLYDSKTKNNLENISINGDINKDGSITTKVFIFKILGSTILESPSMLISYGTTERKNSFDIVGVRVETNLW